MVECDKNVHKGDGVMEEWRRTILYEQRIEKIEKEMKNLRRISTMLAVLVLLLAIGIVVLMYRQGMFIPPNMKSSIQQEDIIVDSDVNTTTQEDVNNANVEQTPNVNPADFQTQVNYYDNDGNQEYLD